MNAGNTNQKLRVVENSTVGELFANKLIATFFDGGAVNLTFGVTRMIPDRIENVPVPANAPSVHVCARLTLTPGAAMEVVGALNGLLQLLQNQAKAQAALSGFNRLPRISHFILSIMSMNALASSSIVETLMTTPPKYNANRTQAFPTSSFSTALRFQGSSPKCVICRLGN
jgi:hypothetical protein